MRAISSWLGCVGIVLIVCCLVFFSGFHFGKASGKEIKNPEKTIMIQNEQIKKRLKRIENKIKKKNRKRANGYQP